MARDLDIGDVIFWYRRDLRVEDNAGFYHALKEHKNVVPIFIFDTNILDQLENRSDPRVAFIYDSISQLKIHFESYGSSLMVYYGNPIEFFKNLSPKAVYTNHDYEPYGIERDANVQSILAKKNIPFHSYKDQVIFEKNEIVKADGKPYTVFTPYSKKWKATLTGYHFKAYPVEKYITHLKKIPKTILPTLADLGFEETGVSFPDRVIKQKVIAKYDQNRNFPAVEGTTKLSVHIRFGTVSIRKLTNIAREKNEVWLNELIWRDFYAMILWHFPHVAKSSFRPQYDFINWRNNEKEFEAWCNGKTGYPIVDAGMRELNTTGFMHNRVRMIVSSFLTKHLLIDWRWGEAYFAKKLLDFDLASNNGGWQWAAGSGCDAAPYFRVFNPYLQTEKFDSKQEYIKKWVPEYGTSSYPTPIVDHKLARTRAMDTYKEGLSQKT